MVKARISMKIIIQLFSTIVRPMNFWLSGAVCLLYTITPLHSLFAVTRISTAIVFSSIWILSLDFTAFISPPHTDFVIATGGVSGLSQIVARILSFFGIEVGDNVRSFDIFDYYTITDLTFSEMLELIKNGDYNTIIIPCSSFDRIKLSNSIEINKINQQLTEINQRINEIVFHK